MLFRAPETHSRSFFKAVSWRILGSVDTFIISYFVTGKLVFAASIASVETVTKVILFYGHERVWAAVPWGRADRVLEAAEHVAEPALAPVLTPVEPARPAVRRARARAEAA